MRNKILLILIFNLLFCNYLTSAQEIKSYIVKFKNNKSVSELNSNLFKPAIKIISDKKLPNLDNNIESFNDLKKYYVIQNTSDTKIVLDEYLKNGTIESVEPNYIYKVEQLDTKPNDPLYPEQWGQFMLNAEKVWQIATGKGIVVAFVDTGIDYKHDDLKENLWFNSLEDINHNGTYEPWSKDEVKDGISGDFDGLDNDGNGFIDDVIGFDFVDQEIQNAGDWSVADGNPYDENNHGTYIAGVIAAKYNNNKGVAGFAFNSKLMPVRAFDASGNGESDDIANAIVYAVLNGAKVINCSFGEDYYSILVHSAVKFADEMGVCVVASSGNNNWSRPHFPSDISEVISVGALESSGVKTLRSNYSTNLSIMAPGVGIRTTTVGNYYTSASGTSLSAPYVSASAAILLEKYPNLKPREIRGIFEATADAIEDNGWDKKTGAGIINPLKALQNVGISDISISYPKQFQIIAKSMGNKLPLIGTISSPLIDSIFVSIEEGNVIEADSVIYSSAQQIVNDTLCQIDLTNLKDTNYTVQIRIKQKNNKYLDRKLSFSIINTPTDLKFDYYEVFPIYDGNKRKYALNLKTNKKSQVKIKYRILDSEDEYLFMNDNQFYTNFHTFILDRLIDGVQYSVIAEVYSPEGFNKIGEIRFTPKIQNFINYDFTKKEYKLPSAYLFNKVQDINKDGREDIILNKYNAGKWHNTEVYSYLDNQFERIDSTSEIVFPLSFGDSNGDGVTDVLFMQTKASRIYQAQDKLFSSLIYKNDTINAACFFDIDYDGKDEIFGYRNDIIYVSNYNNGLYNPWFSFQAPEGFERFSDLPLLKVEDLDNDKKPEIFHSNIYGNVLIYQYDNGNLSILKIDSSYYGDNPRYLETADLDGDGTKEIVFMVATGFNPNDNSIDFQEYEWKLKIYKKIGNDYKVVCEENFNGVRVGSAGDFNFKNGISAGDINNKKGDEIAISLFPYVYIFEWDSGTNTLFPLRTFDNTYSNACLIYDFDKNGVKEIGIPSFEETTFYEYNQDFENLYPPSDFSGYSDKPGVYYLEWTKPDNSINTEIWLFNPLDNSHTLLNTVSNSNDTLSLNINAGYLYLKSIYASGTSYSSAYLEFAAKLGAKPLSAEYRNGLLFIKYSSTIGHKVYPQYFKIINKETFEELSIKTVLCYSDSIIAISLTEPITGDYSVEAASFFDVYQNPTIAGKLDFLINIPNKEEKLYLSSLEVIGTEPPAVYLSFSEDVTESALLKENYSLLPIGDILSISKVDNKKVKMEFRDNYGIGALGREYSITASDNIISLTGKPMTKGTGNTLSFVFISDDINNVFVYPNPIKKDAISAYFANLPESAKIQIFDLNLELIGELEEKDRNGGIEWDLKDRNNKEISSGVYIYKVIDLKTNQESELKKFVIMK